jgi:hypothetical protein
MRDVLLACPDEETLMTGHLRHLSKLTISISLLLLIACSHMKFTNVWVDEARINRAYRNILVIGIADTRGNREDFETYFVEQLKAAGVDALASIKILPDTTKINRETVLAAIEGLDIDAAIVTHLTGNVEVESTFPPKQHGIVHSYGYGPGHINDQMYDYYPYASQYVHQLRNDNTHNVVSLETNLYDAGTEKLVWSGRSSQFAPDSVDDVIVQLTRLVITDLKKKNLLQ